MALKFGHILLLRQFTILMCYLFSFFLKHTLNIHTRIFMPKNVCRKLDLKILRLRSHYTCLTIEDYILHIIKKIVALISHVGHQTFEIDWMAKRRNQTIQASY